MKETWHCHCDDWRKSVNLLAYTLFAQLCSRMYSGMEWIYCPWCGKALVPGSHEDHVEED